MSQSRRTPIIVGVDGTERSVDALALADLLGPALERPVVIAYVHPYGRLSSIFSEGEYESLVREVAESTFDRIREQLRSVPERRMQLVDEKSPAAGLLDLAERERAALIVVGSSHRSSIGRVLPGGTAERLLAGAPAAVAVAPAGYSSAERALRLVGCGFDGSPESRRAVDWAAALARASSVRLRVLSVFQRTLPASLAVGGALATTSVNDVLRRQDEDRLAELISELEQELEVDGRFLDGDARELLARESAELDLLVLGSRGYGPLRSVLLGSVSSGLVRAAQSPLVVMPRGADGVEAAQGSTSPRRIA